VLSIAFVVPFVEPAWDGGAVRAVGFVLALCGIAGESLADAQLARWKRDPANGSRVCDVGLWGYSRHPNYFFEWLVWLGYAVYGLAFHGGWIALIAWDSLLPSRAHPASAIWAQVVAPISAFLLFAAYVGPVPKLRLARAARRRPPTPAEVDLAMPAISAVGLVLSPLVLFLLLVVTSSG
jgi:hypothetical protein